MVEGGFDNLFEEPFVTPQLLDLVAGHPDDRRLDFGRGIEHVLGNGEEIFYIVPGLQQHAQYPVGLAAGRGGHAFGHLFLNHAAATGYAVFIVENLEKYLARDVVGIVADDAEGAFVELGQVELEKVFGDNTVAQLGKVLLQVFDRLGVELDHREVVAFIQQKPGEDSHAGPHLEHGHAFVAGQGVGNRLGYAQVGEKMLSQRFLGFDHVFTAEIFQASVRYKVGDKPLSLQHTKV